MDRGYDRYNRGTPYGSALDSSLLSDDSAATESPANLFSKKATHDTNVHPELRRLAFLLQSELGRHEQQIAKIQYEERKMAIERAFNAVTPLKLRQTGSANFSGRIRFSRVQFPWRYWCGKREWRGVYDTKSPSAEAPLGVENSVLEELDLVASQNAARNGVLMGLSGSGRKIASGPKGSSGALAYSHLFFGAALQLLEEESEKRRNKVGDDKNGFSAAYQVWDTRKVSWKIERRHAKIQFREEES